MLGGRERPRTHLVGVGAHARDHLVLDRGEALGEARAVAVIDAQQVVEHEHLAVGGGTGADADDRDLHALHDRVGDRRGDGLEHDREAAGVLQVEGVAGDVERALCRAPLGAVAAQRGRRLGRQAHVALDRDPGVDDGAGALHGHAAAFELDRVDARLLDEALGGGDRLRIGGLVGAEGQVGDQERRLQPAAHGARQHDHLVHRHGHGGVIAEHGHGARVADQHHVDAGGLGHLGRGEVVGGDHDDGLAALALVGQAGSVTGRRSSAGVSGVLGAVDIKLPPESGASLRRHRRRGCGCRGRRGRRAARSGRSRSRRRTRRR